MNTEICPEPSTLKLLLLGRLTAVERQRLGEHLLHCENCASIAENIVANDDITDALRAKQSIGGDEKIVAQVIEKSKRLHSEIETIGSDNTKTAPQNSTILPANIRSGTQDDQHGLDAESYDFLSPSENRNEIGRLGGYRVLEVMGVGGMGIVFRAEDPNLKRQIALKAMRPVVATSASAKLRFMREAQATAAIDHDNIVAIHQVGEDRGIPFIAMQYLRGESLRTRLQNKGRIQQREALRIGREIANGLAAAHASGLIHRDIKPDNIWLEKGQDRAKILDFGLARSHDADKELTQTGIVMGTPKYMSPEQARGQEVDARCDLFSLGSVLYHMVTGSAPFGGSNLTATLLAVSNDDPEPIDAKCSNLHSDFSGLINRLLSKLPARRPDSAREVSGIISKIEEQIATIPQADKTAEIEVHSDTIAIKQHIDYESKTTVEMKPKVAGEVPRNRRPMIAVLAFFGFLFLLGIITITNKKGTVTVDIRDKVKDNDVEVKIRPLAGGGKEVVLKKANNWTVKLSGGTYSLDLQGGDDQFKLKDNKLTVSRFGTTLVEIKYAPTKEVANADTKDVNSVKQTAARVSTLESKSPNYALLFDGQDDFVSLKSLKYDGTHPITIECQATPSKLAFKKCFPIFNRILYSFFEPYGPNSQRWGVDAMRRNHPTLDDNSARQGVNSDGVSAYWMTPPGNFLHKTTYVAVVHDGVYLRLFVDGHLVGEVAAGHLKPIDDANHFHIGSAFLQPPNGFFQGTIDEVRISKVARYKKDYPIAKRLKSDADTMALYHFDEATGDVLVDASGNGHDGKIHGAKWVPNKNDSRDRSLAAWVFSKGGKVDVKVFRSTDNGYDTIRNLASMEQLPSKQFNIETVNLGGLTSINDQDVNTLQTLCSGSLRVLDLGSTSISDAAIDHLKGMAIYRLYLGETKITDAFAPRLKEIAGLKQLFLNGTSIGDTSYKVLATIDSIDLLDLSTTKITDEGVKAISTLPSLAWLNLSNINSVTDSSLKALAKNPSLRTLLVQNTSVTDIGFQHLEMTHLNRLEFGSAAISDAALKSVACIKTLDIIDVSGQAVSDAGVRFLSTLPALSGKLVMRATSTTDESIDHLAKLKWLKTLDIVGTQVTSEGVDRLQRELPQCEIVWDGGKINPRGTALDRKVANWVVNYGGDVQVLVDRSQKGISSPEEIPDSPFFVTYIALRTDGIKEEELEDLSALRRLANLKMKAISDDQYCQYVSQIKSLENLEVHFSEMRNSGLKTLVNMPRLRGIYIGGTKTTDGGLDHLSSFPNLNGVMLTPNQITPQSIRTLKSLPKLNFLRVDEASDKDLELIPQLTWLTRLLFSSSSKDLTKSGIDRLHSAMPNCEIQWEGGTLKPKKAE